MELLTGHLESRYKLVCLSHCSSTIGMLISGFSCSSIDDVVGLGDEFKVERQVRIPHVGQNWNGKKVTKFERRMLTSWGN
jgi:hypothetical protein